MLSIRPDHARITSTILCVSASPRLSFQETPFRERAARALTSLVPLTALALPLHSPCHFENHMSTIRARLIQQVVRYFHSHTVRIPGISEKLLSRTDLGCRKLESLILRFPLRVLSHRQQMVSFARDEDHDLPSSKSPTPPIHYSNTTTPHPPVPPAPHTPTTPACSASATP